jgi:hypothetical protein
MQFRQPMMLQTAEERQMGLFIHLSQLANLIFFPVGVLIPIILWQTKKEQMPALDAHGKMVVNWQISSFIYIVVSAVLVLVLVGFFLLLAVGLLALIFPIVGAVKANNGELWEYPLTIKFLK